MTTINFDRKIDTIPQLVGQTIKSFSLSTSAQGNQYIVVETDNGMLVEILVDGISAHTVSFPNLNQQLANIMTGLESH